MEHGSVSALQGAAALAALTTVVAAIIPAAHDREDRVRMKDALSDLAVIESRIERYHWEHGDYPPSLSAIGLTATDPWGNAYRYARVSDSSGNGLIRLRAGNLPVNVDFDLYSSGPDGVSHSLLNVAGSRDDIVRAEGFVGWSAEYCERKSCGDFVE